MKYMKYIKFTGVMLVISILLAAGVIYSGVFPVGANNKHNALTFWVIETLRTKSIARASKNIEVPPLDEPKLLLSGGADYNDMCAGCHLQPGKVENDMTMGLYPAPPNLTIAAKDHGHGHEGDEQDMFNAGARQQFWVIKNGIMASGMAAFGKTHDDERIWAMVAFLQKLPELSELQYQVLTARK